MRYFILALVALVSFNAFAGTNIQYQAHAPAGSPTEAKFSIYIADSSFDENSHLNSNALWYRENENIEINNGIVNYLIENVADNILIDNYGKKLFVYAYVDGVSLGRLQIRSVPYSLLSTYSLEAAEAKHSETSDKAKLSDSSNKSAYSFRSKSSETSEYADSAAVSNHSNTSKYSDTSRAAGKATLSDLATYASTAAHSAKSDTAFYSINGNHSNYSDTSVFAYDADHANFASTSAFATNSARSVLADTAKTLVDNSIEHRNFQPESVRLSSLEGSSTAPVGSYAVRGTNGISWEVNPQHRTSSVQIYTAAPTSIPGDTRWVVSRVAVDYNIVSPTNPVVGQLVSIFNGSTANQLTVRAVTWNTDTALDYTIWPNQSRTLWFDGTNWVVVE
jgi:hypothetical protein